MKRTLMAMAFATAGLLALAGPASAGPLYDQNIGGGLGFFNGTGNPDGGFTEVDNGGYTSFLRAKLRQSGSVIDSSNNNYAVPAGSQIGVSNRAAWNWEFSLGCNDGSCGNAGILSVLGRTLLTVTDMTSGHAYTVNMGLNYLDDSTWAGGVKGNLASAGAYVAQNSENPVFADFPLTQGGFPFDMNAQDTYNFRLDVLDQPGGSVVNTNNINVCVGTPACVTAKVPEPKTVMMFLLAIAGLWELNRRRKQSGAI